MKLDLYDYQGIYYRKYHKLPTEAELAYFILFELKEVKKEISKNKKGKSKNCITIERAKAEWRKSD